MPFTILFFVSATKQGDNALGSVGLSVLSCLNCLTYDMLVTHLVCNQEAYGDDLVEARGGGLTFNPHAIVKKLHLNPVLRGRHRPRRLF